MTQAHIIGWGHTAFGKHDALEAEDLFREAAQGALDTAGLAPADIDGGFLRQYFSGAMAAQAFPELRHTPSVRLENACATGSAAIWGALDAVASGRMRHALVVGFEKMNTLPNAQIGETIRGESHAWVEWFTGEWNAWDPTNLIDIGERHVKVGLGRDYNDVPPLRGVYAGAGKSQLFVSVEITKES